MRTAILISVLLHIVIIGGVHLTATDLIRLGIRPTGGPIIITQMDAVSGEKVTPKGERLVKRKASSSQVLTKKKASPEETKGETNGAERGGLRVITLSELIEEGNTPPNYPAEAIKKSWEGFLKLKLITNQVGSVVSVELLESSGHGILDYAAIKAAETWNLPKDNYEVPIRFQLVN